MMQADGEKYSLRYGKSQKEIADAYLELVKRGYSGKQALGAMNTELQGSIASGDDFKDVVEVASQTLEGFGMTVNKNGKQLSSTKEMTVRTKKAVNTLAYSADVTSTSFQSLGGWDVLCIINSPPGKVQSSRNGECNGCAIECRFRSRQGFGKTGRLASNRFEQAFC